MLGRQVEDKRTLEQVEADKAAFVAKLKEQEKTSIERLHSFQEKKKRW